MRRPPRVLFYFFTVIGLLSLIFFVVEAGKKLESARPVQEIIKPGHNAATGAGLCAQVSQPVPLFLLQLFVLLLAVRLFGWLFKKIKQPAVVGEILAGIVLGPSLFGLVLPQAQQFLFPKTSLPSLQLLSQLGLCLFMFVVGIELDLSLLRKKAGAAVIISHTGIVIPYGLGVALAYFLYGAFAPAGTPFYTFALFMGIAMSITAFPVLARILKERGMTQTRLGTLALSCAAADDVTAWCILALVIALAKAGPGFDALRILGLTLAFGLLMFAMVRPLLERLARLAFRGKAIKQAPLAGALIVLVGSAFLSELIGIHALFGAFVAGVAMPSNEALRHAIADKIQDLALVLLLPLFFVFTGLRTQVNLLDDATLWGITALIIGVAVLGKLGGSTLAARITGESWRDSLAIGALMNTRGLVELVVLNIGYDLGILSGQLFFHAGTHGAGDNANDEPAAELAAAQLWQGSEPCQSLTAGIFEVATINMRKLHTDPLIPGSYYHIYNRGVNGCDLFYELRNYVYFLKKYATYITPVADTFAYCLLRNHFHLLVRIKAPEELVRNKPDQILHPVADIATLQFSHLLNGYAQAINKAVGRSGALFESPFRRILVDNSAYLHQLVYYIHTNPERHGFISDYREYPHSSYKTFLSAKQSLLMRATALEWFGGMDGFAECHAAGALSGMPGFEREMVIEFE